MNRTNSKFSVKNLVLGALFLALALVLPFFTGHIPQIGAMLCPMHLPILLAGFICGGPVGAVVGFIAPLLRMVMFGMPPFYVAIAMAFELLTYGLVSGIMYRKVFKKQTVGTLYGSLLIAMVAGRIVWGIVKVILSGIAADAGAFTFAAFISGALLNAIPGIVVQLILVPAVVVALQKAKLIETLVNGFARKTSYIAETVKESITFFENYQKVIIRLTIIGFSKVFFIRNRVRQIIPIW